MHEGRSGGQVSMLPVLTQYEKSMSILTVIISDVLLTQSQFTMRGNLTFMLNMLPYFQKDVYSMKLHITIFLNMKVLKAVTMNNK
jgi:hypothetical protein